MDDTQKQFTGIPGQTFIGKHFRMLADISTAAIFVYDLEAGDFSLLVNTVLHLGLTEPELRENIQASNYTTIQHLLQDFIHADDVSTALEAHGMLQTKRAVRYMARLKYADGTYRWRNIYYTIHREQENGRRILSGYVTDIHDTKVYKGILERFTKSAGKSFLCLDMNTDNYILFGSHENHSPVLAVGSNYSRSIVDFANSYVVPEDRESCIAQMQTSRVAKVLRSSPNHTFSLNLLDHVAGISHKSLKYNFYDKNNNLVLVTLGDQTRQLADEVEYARIIKEAMFLANTDPLTGLYNRHSGEELIKKVLEKSTGAFHALVLLEIEHFECVSKGVGESFGEAILTDVSLRLKRLFRSNDILARVEDMRFMLFMTDIPDEESAIRKVEEIRRIISETYTSPKSQHRLSCNAGLVFINGRPNFDAILRSAQSSLQTAMQVGDNTYHIYQETKSLSCPSMPAMSETEACHIDLVLHLKERIFEILYSTPDFEQSVHMALALIGGILDVSRVYVFENSSDNQTTSNTFEWCCETASSEIHNLQNLPFASVDYATQFDANGLFNCPDINATHGKMRTILSMQGIRALLQVAIKDGNEVIGFVGFDECRKSRSFTATEIDTLCFVAKIIGTFVRKKRMTDLFTTAEQDKVEALDNLPSFIYVLDRDHRLLYMNKMVNMLVPGALVGMKCYSALKGLDEPCPGCPAIRCEHGRCSVEMYNPRYNLWVISSATRITWGGQKDMILVSCQDITSFKIMRAIS